MNSKTMDASFGTNFRWVINGMFLFNTTDLYNILNLCFQTLQKVLYVKFVCLAVNCINYLFYLAVTMIVWWPRTKVFSGYTIYKLEKSYCKNCDFMWSPINSLKRQKRNWKNRYKRSISQCQFLYTLGIPCNIKRFVSKGVHFISNIQQSINVYIINNTKRNY